ncbi:MAG: hypothetical protein M3271_12225 [Actinomycetota bacterium]|nr:hypothetical protein [Actinomycetota bacterium]
MHDDQEEQQSDRSARRAAEEENDRPRPKVVDKRISARSAAPAAEPGPAAEGAPEATADVTVGTVPEPEPPQAPSTEEAPPAGGGSGTGERVWTPEQEAEARRMAEEIARTPSFEWVMNTAATLANVAGTKLDLGAAADAQLAIDALAGIVNAVGPRLGAAERPLRQLLADLQLAYAQRVAGPEK